MSRGNASGIRCLVVWLGASAALAATAWLAGGTAATLAHAATWQRSFEDLLVAVCAAVVLGCGARLWVVTTATAVGLVRGRVPREARGLTRRLVLAACGAVVVAGVATPAVAGQGGDTDRLVGLPLPDRATASSSPPVGAAPPARAAPVAHRAPVAAPDEVVVRSGDSLWTLAAARLPRSAGPAEVDRAWREVYAANRAEIGADPGLIRPGQRLQLPPTDEGDVR
ncbi:LysM peptidoglycan-binding domain-containing protein [Nocardioides terrigena]|uniref:LysM peptidoglycan-binding domain-containing protein n=1 Tax=Nocardioides terrigena TaxID=424797 RepID=UPI001901E974|nr:LysM peptidoglycan-binding domain-containing protein [Nocardioides terrigena]